MPTLTARTLIASVGTVEYPCLTVSADGLIEDISTDASIRSDKTLASASFDIHVHGAANHDLMQASPDGLHTVQRFLATKGVAYYLPTTVTASIDETLAALGRLANLIESPVRHDEAQPLGIHLEGPFLSHAKRGVHPPELLQRPSIELFTRFQQAARGHIKLLTLAPEVEGAVELTQYATAQGTTVSVGHTNASAAETLAAIAAGASSATHTFNAMRPLDHREPGVLGTVLDREDLYAELICDGIHVDPVLVRMWLRLKREKAILVTDGISATGMGDGVYRLGPLEVAVQGDRCSLLSNSTTLAGSVLTLDRAVANLQRFTGTSLATATRCASHYPAAMLGLGRSVGSIAPGAPANFNLYGAHGELEATYLYGQRVTA